MPFISCSLQDHPRRCGENTFARSFRVRLMGSPPQVRGKRTHAGYRPRGVRITPAGAGKTHGVRDRRGSRQDHPRRCGENPKSLTVIISQPGSPPQVRGKLTQMPRRGRMLRITPAGAGKTRNYCLEVSDMEDHPRRCGENRRMQPQLPRPRGSPPQVRGKRRVCRAGCHKHGITPAGAGKTILTVGQVLRLPDHPRRCGENLPMPESKDGTLGSPPQVRGKHTAGL